MSRHWIITNLNQFIEFHRFLKAEYRNGKYIYVSYKTAKQRSLDQNALFHVWCREFSAHHASCKLRDVTEDMMTDTKYTFKKLYYQHTGNPELIKKNEDIFTGEKKSVPQSTKIYSVGTMFDFMEFVQNLASTKDLMLESSGQYLELKKSGGV